MQNDGKWFRERFNTTLSEKDEKKFQAWIADGKAKYGVDLTQDIETYDLRGFWLAGGYKDEAFRARKGHAPDTYKKPNHPTFSNESIYHNVPSEYGGKWQGGKWLSETEFEPSPYMLEHTHPVSWYTNHMAKYGGGVKLRMPIR